MTTTRIPQLHIEITEEQRQLLASLHHGSQKKLIGLFLEGLLELEKTQGLGAVYTLMGKTPEELFCGNNS